jgi:cytochrome P450
VGYDPWAPNVIANPYPWYQRLRDETPCYHEPEHDIWVLSRYDDVMAAARAHDRLSSADGVLYARMPLPMMLTIDPPDHTRLRRLVTRDFTPRTIETWRPLIERTVDEIVEPLFESTSDFMASAAFPLPVVVIADVLGIPRDDHPQFTRWSDDIVKGFGLTTPDAVLANTVIEAILAVKTYLTALIDERRRHPGDDLLSRLAQPGDEGKLTDEELFWFCLLLLVAGNETTTNLLGNMLLAFVEHPEQWRLLRERPELITAAVEEALRFDSPIQGLFRTAVAQYTVAGIEIPIGARALLLYGAANRDPRRFETADEFLVERNPADHVAFGSGIHLCLGAHLARLEGAAVLRALLERAMSVDLAGEPIRGTNASLRGLVSLPLTFARN